MADDEKDHEIPEAVRAVYGPNDLSSAVSFGGGFINFGYWADIPLDRPLTGDDRIRSEQALYRRVLRELGEDPGNVVEVGCGLGLGCAMALSEFGARSVTGMDIHPDQLERAKATNRDLLERSGDRLRFVRGAAERMPLAKGEFDGLYSLEAAQHFRDLRAFAHETARVLRPGGRAVVSSFFTPAPGGADELARRLDSFAEGLDVAHALPTLTGALQDADLTDVRSESIGEHVWKGLDHFLAGLDLPIQWPRNFLSAHHDGLLDYYIITARKPARP